MTVTGLELFTIGHSTHPADVFGGLLERHGITRLADVRTVPKSARNPQFNGTALEASLRARGITYRHFPALGGLRKPRRDSTNTAWRHPSFRGYADHMQTPAFQEALDSLLEFAQGHPTVVMCAEAVWWQCHRQLIADALLARGVPVRHILPTGVAKPHRLSEFAKVDHGRVTYPGLV
jgi:uncharacterized protein (DUF488 family)